MTVSITWYVSLVPSLSSSTRARRVKNNNSRQAHCVVLCLTPPPTAFDVTGYRASGVDPPTALDVTGYRASGVDPPTALDVTGYRASGVNPPTALDVTGYRASGVNPLQRLT